MKRKGLIVVALVISLFLCVHGAWAATVSYIDAGQSAIGGVVGAKCTSTIKDSKALYGVCSGTTGQTYAVFGWNYSREGNGVLGLASASTGTTYGVQGSSRSTSGRGVYGSADATTGTTYGVYGYSNSTSGRGVYGYARATTGYTYGVYGYSRSTSGRGVYGFAGATTGTTYGVYGRTNSPNGYGVYSFGNMHVQGNFTASGDKSSVVALENGEGVTLYAEEAPYSWFVDYGSAKLEDGKAVVEIDPTYAQTVNTNVDYHVFLAPRGDCKGLYVTHEKETSFEVRELNGGKSNTPFSYRIVAKRKGYEDKRLARISKEQMASMAAPFGEDGIVEKDNTIEKVALSVKQSSPRTN